MLHHRERIELAIRIYGQSLANSEKKIIETGQILTEHLTQDLGKVVCVEDWARDLFPQTKDSFYHFLAKKRKQIENEEVAGENQLFDAFYLSANDRLAVKDFLAFPLKNSTHPAALLVSHNSFAIFLAERVLGVAFVKERGSKKQLVSVREVFERLIFLRLRAVLSPAEVIARTSEAGWMRGAVG